MRMGRTMFRLALLLVVALALAFCTGALADSVVARLQVQYDQQAARSMLAMINEFRQGSDAWYWNEDDTTKTELTDLAALTYDYELEQVAMQRAAELVALFGHVRPNGEQCYTAYPSMSAMGENIAAGQCTAQAAFTSWQETDEPYSGQGHRRNMLKANFNVIGIGHAIYNGTHYWVHVLGKKTTPDTTETTAEMSFRDMAVEIDVSRVENKRVEVSPETLQMDIGQSCPLPDVRQSYSVAGGWPRNLVVNETLEVEWNVGDANLASISDGRVTAQHAGTSVLTSTDGSYSVPLDINHIALDDSDYTLAVGSVRYNGIDQRPEVSVAHGGAALTLNTDYMVAYENNTDVGQATVKVTGIGDYTGEKTLVFEILPCKHEWGEPIVNKSPSYEETGKRTSICVKCGATQEETLPLLPTPTPVPTAMPTPTPGPTPVTEWTPSQDGEGTINLPEQLKTIEESAFEGVQAEEVIIPDGVERIENRAFADSEIKHVYLPNSVEHIEDDVFDQVDGVVVDVEPDSYAEQWAVERDYINTPDGNFEYRLEDDGCTIVRYTGALDKVRVPPAIDGTPVTAVADGAFKDCASVTEIILPETLATMGKDVFSGCASLVQFTIPETITAIPDGTFSGCLGLTEYLVPEHITAVGDGAFKNCANLRRFTVHNGLTAIGSEAFSGCASLEYILLTQHLTEIGEDAFAGCDKLRIVAMRDSAGEGYVKANQLPNYKIYDPMYSTYGDELLEYQGTDPDLVVPQDLGLIGVHDRAFEDCGTTIGGMFVPISVTLPEGMTRIGHRAFMRCDQLATVNLPQTMVSINSSAFEQCSMLSSITIPDNVEYIGNSAFSDCTALKSVQLGQKLSSIGASAFYGCSKLTDVTIPDSVTSIGGGAFSNCIALKSVVLPDRLTSMEGAVFYGCSVLDNVTLPAGLQVLPGNTFCNCSKLKNVTLPEGLTAIGNWAFGNCKALTQIAIPASVTSIGEFAFSGCYQLKTVYGVPGSYAETWAAEQGKTFMAIDE